ncbi:hypothetical protein AB0333_01155 [Citricoccus sp. NPDC079358]|uniref:hypothetical protein n=1 Tax=Citricoccus sp. NPDC079358 TaxID=3154653 RepID=UPI00344D8164
MTGQDDPFPDDSSLRALLEDYQDEKVFVIDITDAGGRSLGNNGDQLMYAVFRKLLGAFGMSPVESADEATLLIVPPNGALLEQYRFPTLLAERLANLPDLPLVIFPSSAFFRQVDPSFIFGKRDARTLWILREKPSYEQLSGRWGEQLAHAGVELALDHDVVVSGHRFVPEVIGEHATQDTALVAARVDLERRGNFGVSGVHAPQSLTALGSLASAIRKVRSRAFDILPESGLKTRAARSLHQSTIRSASAEMVESLSREHQGQIEAAASRVFTDLSSTRYATFDEYRRSIGRSSLVVTNRLHVGLPAAILGKHVVLVEAGYHKLGGVYDRSLSAALNVELVRAS